MFHKPIEQIEHRQMSGVKDSDNRVVVHFPTWVRVLGVITSSMAVAFLYFFLLATGGDMAAFMSPIGLIVLIFCPFWLFLGIYWLHYTCQFIFDHTRGNLTIKSSIGPIMYRSMIFLRGEVIRYWVSTQETAGTPTLWRVSLWISGRKKHLNIPVNNKKMANYLANRIKALVSSG